MIKICLLSKRHMLFSFADKVNRGTAQHWCWRSARLEPRVSAVWPCRRGALDSPLQPIPHLEEGKLCSSVRRSSQGSAIRSIEIIGRSCFFPQAPACTSSCVLFWICFKKKNGLSWCTPNVGRNWTRQTNHSTLRWKPLAENTHIRGRGGRGPCRQSAGLSPAWWLLPGEPHWPDGP